MTDTISRARRSWNMARIGSKDTRPELLVRKALHEAGFRFRLHRRDLPGKPDVILPKLKLVVFVHGCYWHGHECWEAKPAKSNRRYWGPKIARNMRRDRAAAAALRRLGWRTAVIRECSLKTRIPALIRRAERLSVRQAS